MDNSTFLKKHRSWFGNALALCQRILLKDTYKKGDKLVWIILVPLLDVFFVSLSIIVCYVIDTLKHNIPPPPVIATISELGITAPTSYIFTLGMTTSSLTTFLIVFFRQKQVSFSRDDCSNTISMVVGYLAAVSKLFVGAFRYHPQFSWLHYSAFISYVFFSYTYIVTQVFLTYYTKTVFSTVILMVRLIISMLMVVFGVLFCVIKLPQYEKINQPPYNVAQTAHWIYWSLLNMYTLTFTIDFTKIRLSWNIQMSPPVHRSTLGDPKPQEKHSSRVLCTEFDAISENHAVIERYGSDLLCETRV